MKDTQIRRRFYVGLLPYEGFFYIGGVSAEEGKKHSFDNVSNLSYGIFHAYVDVIDTEDGPKIERFGIKNGSIRNLVSNESVAEEITYEQTTDLFGLFDGETMKNIVGVKTCNNCCDKEMKSLMRTIENTEIKTRIDGIEIPAKVIDNLYFIVKDEINCSPTKRACRIETNANGEVTLFECYLLNEETAGVIDAHNGYAECVKEVKERTESLKEKSDNELVETNPCIYASLTGDGTITATVPYEDYDYSTTYSVEPEYFEPDNGEEEIDYDFEADEIDRIKFTRVGEKIKRITIYFK